MLLFIMISSSIRFIRRFSINRLVSIAAIGIITEFVRKSKKIQNCMPIILIPTNGPYPSEDKLPSAIMITPTKTVALLLHLTHPQR